MLILFFLTKLSESHCYTATYSKSCHCVLNVLSATNIRLCDCAMWEHGQLVCMCVCLVSQSQNNDLNKQSMKTHGLTELIVKQQATVVSVGALHAFDCISSSFWCSLEILQWHVVDDAALKHSPG